MRTLVGLIIFAGLLPLSEAGAIDTTPQNPKSAKACAICHYRWIDTFFIEGRGSDLVPYQSEKVVATPDMCISCHDGSIMDSRARMTTGAGHKTNIRPPDGMDIPSVFPLDEKGRVQCATCHTAHGVPSGAGEDTTIFMRISNKDSAMCWMCHPGKNGGAPSRNHTIGSVNTRIPDSMLELSTAAGQKPNRIACETCHTAHGSKHEAYLIQSARNASLCLACHTDKGLVTPEGRRNPGHVVNVRPTTASIPESFLGKGARTGENGEIICSTCHKVHGSPTDTHLLLMADDGQSALCLSCHADKQAVAETGHNLGKSAPQSKNLQGQSVAQAGVCSACHLPHKPARMHSGSADFTSQQCMSCHGTGSFAAREKLLTGHNHPLGDSPFRDRSNGILLSPVQADPERMALPLFTAFGIRSQNGVITCATCHDPHRQLPATGTEPASRKTSTANQNRYLRESPAQICRQCHAAKFSIADTRHNLRHSAPSETNRQGRKASEVGVCDNCHMVHGGEQYFLWAKELPLSSDNRQRPVCFSCHVKDGSATKKEIQAHSHPLDISPAAEGAKTRLPLFDADNRPSADGRMSCYTCHDPHRWEFTGKNIDGADTEGDARNSFLRLPASPSSKLCGDCHGTQALIEQTGHNLITSMPQAKNTVGQVPQESGPCGVCHLSHNSKNKLLRWGQKFGHGSSIMEQTCTGCHSKRGAAARKIPAISYHPEDIAIHNTGRSRKSDGIYFPLFDSLSGESVYSGPLSCPSCHDVHRWSVGELPGDGPGKPTGSLASSFLRNRSHETICMDCHGPEALVRYAYYHHPAKR